MEKAVKGIFWINTKLKQLEKACGCICLGVLFAVMISNAMLRYCLRSGFNWSDELNQFLFVWMGFLAAAHAMGDDRHLNVSAFISLFPKSFQFIVRQIMNMIMLVFFCNVYPGAYGSSWSACHIQRDENPSEVCVCNPAGQLWLDEFSYCMQHYFGHPSVFCRNQEQGDRKCLVWRCF